MAEPTSATAQVAFNDRTIIYDPEIIASLPEQSDFIIEQVPTNVISILDGLPSSDFYFEGPVKTISELPGREPEYLVPTTPRATIEKAKQKIAETLRQAA